MSRWLDSLVVLFFLQTDMRDSYHKVAIKSEILRVRVRVRVI